MISFNFRSPQRPTARPLVGLLAVTCLVVATLAAPGRANEQPIRMRTFYFGNSLTAGTAPDFHGDLAKARGDTWENGFFGIAGGRLQQYVDLLFPRYPEADLPAPKKGDRAAENALRARQAIESGTWDAVVIQPHQAHLTGVANYLKPPREAGDIAEGGKLVEWARKHQPKAQIYLYQTWAVPAPIGDDQENPDFEKFDYETSWLRPYANPAPDGDPNPKYVMRTQDYHKRLLAALNKNHAAALRGQPIRVIPTGDVMLELDRRLKAGKFVNADGKPFTLTRRTVVVDNEKDKNLVDIRTERIPFDDIGVFYQDFQHQNPGLPRYFDAAVFYATLFGRMPVGLDYAKYNVFPKKGDDGKTDLTSSYNWKANDNRHFIEITPELADALGALIWDVVGRHPDAGIAPKAD